MDERQTRNCLGLVKGRAIAWNNSPGSSRVLIVSECFKMLRKSQSLMIFDGMRDENRYEAVDEC